MSENHRSRLTRALQAGRCLPAMGVHDGLSALLVEQAGFELGFVSGAGISFARHGRPDMGLVSMTEVADVVARLRERVAMPLFVDIDTGFGNALNVQRTVRVMEAAGATAMQLEDQLAPKRCGHMAGKQVIDAGEMVGKIKAALDARVHDDTLIVARTDALGVNGFDDALERAERYAEAGADGLFIEAPKSVEQMQTIAQRFARRLPLVHNLVEGGASPVDSAAALDDMGYRIALFPIALLQGFVPMAQRLLADVHASGKTTDLGGLMDLHALTELLGAGDLLAASERYKS